MTAAVAACLSLGATSASAVTTGTFVGLFSGNDECPGPGGNKTNVAAMGSSFCLAKFNSLAGTTSGFGTGETGTVPAAVPVDLTDNFTLTGGNTTMGTFSYDDQGEGFSLTHMILKASNQFAVYALNGASSGDWMTGPVLHNTGGTAQDISHISFFGVETTTVPVPAALPLALMGIGGLAFAGRRRKTG